MVFGNVSLYLLQDVESYILPLVVRNIFTGIKSYDFQSVANSTVTIKRLQLLNLISHITLLDV
jgi:hypothetical protein